MGTNIDLAFRSKKLILPLIAVVLLLSCHCPLELLAQDATQRGDDESTQAGVLLRWKFVPDEVIRVKQLFNKTTEGEQNKRTELIYEYRWKVEDVDSDGTAMLTVQFDRIRFRHRSDECDFDFDIVSNHAHSGDRTLMS